ncbi:MAG: metal ABC transporter substrate-binding protein [Lachnospiraceae bacterium]|nr:metal ABC transporter substrate-binding protein [Lachnospiraceae bacterium]
MTFCMMTGLLTGCGQVRTDSASAGEDGKVSVVCTIYPAYDWVREVLGEQAENVSLTCLLDNGVDLHSYQPTAMDIATIANSDIFIYVGGESDEWVDDALAEAVNPNMQVLNLMELLGDAVKEEEVKEGMEGHDHDHDHEDGEEHDHEDGEEHDHEDGEEHDHEDGDEHDHEHGEEPEYDEHVWLSLKNAQVLVAAITDALKTALPASAEEIQASGDAYLAKLKSLDAEYESAVAAGARKTIVFGDRFPFRYLVDDYGLDYFAAFVGCSAETEASFETVVFLAGKIDEIGAGTISVIESSDQKIAQTIVSNTGSKDQKILVWDSMQSSTTAGSASYLKIMQSNLEVLRQALQ